MQSHNTQAVTSGDGFWAAFCNGFEEGIDCLTGETGQLDDLLEAPLHLGNVLDYGADPNGTTQSGTYMMRWYTDISATCKQRSSPPYHAHGHRCSARFHQAD
jgi:hypothetical protein